MTENAPQSGSMQPRWSMILDEKLAPSTGEHTRADCVRWLLYAVATLQPSVLEVMLVEAKGDKTALERAKGALSEHTRAVESALEGQPHLLGAERTAADVAVGRVLAWAVSLGLLERESKLAAYAARVTADAR